MAKGWRKVLASFTDKKIIILLPVENSRTVVSVESEPFLVKFQLRVSLNAAGYGSLDI